MTVITASSTRAIEGAACRSFSWRFRGALYLGVVVKATFRLVAGDVMTLTTPRAIREHEDPETGLYPSDLVPYRPTADVVVRATRQRHATRLHMRLDRDQEILVDKSADVTDAWMPRVARNPFTASRGRVLEVPETIDWDVMQCAPVDQRAHEISDGVTLRFVGVHPTEDFIHFILPSVRGEAMLAEAGTASWSPLALPLRPFGRGSRALRRRTVVARRCRDAGGAVRANERARCPRPRIADDRSPLRSADQIAGVAETPSGSPDRRGDRHGYSPR